VDSPGTFQEGQGAKTAARQGKNESFLNLESSFDFYNSFSQ
jgi:hypothetical protein